MGKRNWYETIGDNVPMKFEFNLPRFENNLNHLSDLFSTADPFGFKSIGRIDDLMSDLEGFGFQDKGSYYEMVMNLGGQKGEGEVPEDAVKIELGGKDGRIVKITYEHSTSEDENCFYSHSQRTKVMLPADADDNTIKAHFNDDGNVVIWVKKKVKEEEKKTTRFIPVKRRFS